MKRIQSVSAVFPLILLIALVSHGLAANWSVSQPASGSHRTKTANVVGMGLAGAADGASATFVGWYLDANETPVEEQSVAVTASMMSWSGTVSPPGGGWNVSPKDGMGMYVGDHSATIRWLDPQVLEHGTAGHVVQD